MKLATTTGDFDGCFDSYEEKIRALYEAGFRFIDMNFYTQLSPDSTIMCDNWRKNVESIKAAAEELGMEFVQAHSAGGNPLCHDEKWDMLLASTIRSIEVCALLGIPSTVVHLGWEAGIGKDEYFEKNLAFYKLLFPAMENNGVNVLIENSTKANMGKNYYFYTGAEMKEFLQYADHPLLHACWDTGHANIEGHQYQDIMDLGADLYGVHINDNRGKSDEHIMPYQGTMNMDEVMNALIDSKYSGVFTFEASEMLRKAKYWLGDRQVYEKDTRLANPPLCLKRQAEKLLYETGVYILDSYGVLEQ